jgi:hypothetical protein
MRGVPRIEAHQPDIEGFSAQNIVTDAVIVDAVAGVVRIQPAFTHWR